jgi:hypothetical protein
VREGAEVVVSVDPDDLVDDVVIEVPWRGAHLEQLIGTVRLGGDALEDSQHPFGR